MANVLEKIVENKRQELIEQKARLDIDTVKAGLQRSQKSLFAALAEPEAGFILECKKASPSKGLIRDPFDLDEIIDAYAPHAAAISVLTDQKYFQGSYENLERVTAKVSQPVLNKDFFIDPYQVYLARYYQADAILLMLSVLSDEQYAELADIADGLGLDILTEVSNEEEMQRAIALNASIIGINNRNLRDLSTDLGRTEALVPMLENADHDFVVISESGIYTHEDVLRLSPYCDGFLVGSALMAQPDLPMAVKSLIYGAVKVCGITDADAAYTAFKSGASFAGFIFATQSPRALSVDAARQIATAVPGSYAGVFVDASVDDILHAVQTIGLSAVQLHNNTDATFRQSLRNQLPESCQIWQVVGVADALPDSVTTLLDDDTVDYVLLDTRVGSQTGGTGKQFDWSLLASLSDKSRVILAGGISPDSIVEARQTGAAIIDVSSGVEASPGQKSAEKIQTLFTNLRNY